MITLIKPDSLVQLGSFGDSPGRLQPQVRSTISASGLQITLEWAGSLEVLAAFQATDSCKAGATTLPQSLTLVDNTVKIKLAESELIGEEGFTGVLRNTYLERNERETDGDMAAGLVSRMIGMQWVERQEQLELFAARITDSEMGVFNPTLLEMWRIEECADVKADFMVRLFTEAGGERIYLKTVALDNDDGDIPVSLKGSPLTKAVAQRIAQGVEYGGRNNIQIVATEIWRVPPTLEYKCNEILPAGIPAAHQPLFSMPTPAGTTFAWMRLTDYCTPMDSGAYSRSTTYLGMPKTAMPNPVPAYWGTTPFDELLYTSSSAPEA